MNRYKRQLETITMEQLYQMDELPKLFRTYNKRQIIEMIVGLATFMIRGIGVIFLLVSLLDYAFFSYTYVVRNMKTGDSYSMDKAEWKRYRKAFKEQKES